MTKPEKPIKPFDPSQSPTVQASSRVASVQLRAGRNVARHMEQDQSTMTVPELRRNGRNILLAAGVGTLLAGGIVADAIVTTAHTEGAGGSDEPAKAQVQTGKPGNYDKLRSDVERLKAHNSAVAQVSADREAEKKGAVIETIAGDDGKSISPEVAAIARGESPAPALAPTPPPAESPFKSGQPNQIGEVDSLALSQPK